MTAEDEGHVIIPVEFWATLTDDEMKEVLLNGLTPEQYAHLLRMVTPKEET